MADNTLSNRYKACLLGGAIGDALGAPVEFNSLERIHSRFGPSGITDLVPAYGKLGAITDDTQMTLFTAEGLIRAAVRGHDRGMVDITSVVHHAYFRWLATQGRTNNQDFDGLLFQDQRLHSQRAPGNTCLQALSDASHFGDKAINDSKGCGVVMRITPIGLLFDNDKAYDLAYKNSLLTHGHITSAISSGILAVIIAQLRQGKNLPEIIDEAISMSQVREAQDKALPETSQLLQAAKGYSQQSDLAPPDAIKRLGEGWVAEEALAISVYCALKAENFADGVIMAVNHDGDSDSTGSITGQILGILFGLGNIPQKWLDTVELSDRIEVICEDMTRLGDLGNAPQGFFEKYPGY